MLVRDAQPEEFAEIGDIRVCAYQADGFLSPGSTYAPTLRALGTNGDGDILVAVAEGKLAGTVMLQLGGPKSDLVSSADEAEIRALAVAPAARGQGTGRALLTAVIARAVQRGVRHLVLCTQTEMHAAQQLYASAGFGRLADRDWSPVPGVTLIAYGLRLPPG
ncbi:MAG TPA: GNAT family N-acetyltransferase [Streptosporangiaceae bacterium]